MYYSKVVKPVLEAVSICRCRYLCCCSSDTTTTSTATIRRIVSRIVIFFTIADSYSCTDTRRNSDNQESHDDCNPDFLLRPKWRLWRCLKFPSHLVSAVPATRILSKCTDIRTSTPTGTSSSSSTSKFRSGIASSSCKIVVAAIFRLEQFPFQNLPSDQASLAPTLLTPAHQTRSILPYLDECTSSGWTPQSEPKRLYPNIQTTACGIFL